MAMTDDIPDCPFCAIVRGDDTSVEVVAEGERWIAFFPINPATLGHTLVIPRRHRPDLWAVDRRLGSDLMEAVVLVGRAIQVAVEPEGMNLISSSGPAAEQTVFHLHLHVVPRWHGDGIDRIWPRKVPRHKAVRKGLAAKVREACETLAG
jgi:histidine triad (HIT) family protein